MAAPEDATIELKLVFKQDASLLLVLIASVFTRRRRVAVPISRIPGGSASGSVSSQ